MRLLPANTTALEQALEQSQSQAYQLPLPIRSLWDVESCPVPWLPWLAWALSVDTWCDEWTDDHKRSVIAASITQHRQKGTVAAVRAALASLPIDVTIEEWFVYGGEPHTFRLLSSANQRWAEHLPPVDDTVVAQVARTINPVKPVRSHYQLVVTLDIETTVSLATVMQVVIFLPLSITPSVSFSGTVTVAARVQIITVATLSCVLCLCH